MSELIQYIAEFLKVLSDETRLNIIELLRKEKLKSARDIQEALDKSQSTISQHLKTLSGENLIDFEVKDNVKYYFIKDLYLLKLLSSITSFTINLNREKLKALTDLNIFETLL